MLLLVVSDFHLGKGPYISNGQLNILEDFHEDERFAEFLDFHSSGSNYLADVHLVLNGDILNLIQVDVDGIFSHLLDEETTVRQVEKIFKGHSVFFDALKNFALRPNKQISYIVGNHDSGMLYAGAQKRFIELLGARVDFHMEKNFYGVYIEHGHRFEAVNYVEPDRYFIKGPRDETILNLPWGSLFCISLLPILKKDRPFIDKVRPLGAFVKWSLFHDLFYFFRILYTVLKYILASSISSYTKNNTSFITTLRIISQITIYPRYTRHAKKILDSNPEYKAVVMGHSHVLEWRRYSGGRYYLNSGTWNTIPSINPAQYENIKKLSYVHIDIHVKSGTFRDISVKEWRGKWRPFRDEFTVAL